MLTGWTYTRVIYLLMGMLISVQSGLDKQWVGVAFGMYFAAMGLFAFGCAAGNCAGGSCRTEHTEGQETTTSRS